MSPGLEGLGIDLCVTVTILTEIDSLKNFCINNCQISVRGRSTRNDFIIVFVKIPSIISFKVISCSCEVAVHRLAALAVAWQC